MLNPHNDPFVSYLADLVRLHVARVRSGRLDRGASAIEWAVIAGLAVLIAIAAYAIIKAKVTTAANNIKTGP